MTNTVTPVTVYEYLSSTAVILFLFKPKAHICTLEMG
jgi:hypothetical protein